MSEKLSLMMYFTLDDFLISVLANQIIRQNSNLFSITLRFFLDLLYMQRCYNYAAHFPAQFRII